MAERYDRYEYADASTHYDVGDLWYWEHRHGRWYAQVLNETDTAFDSISPINVRRILDCFLAFPEAERSEAVVQYALIQRQHPVLLFFGINSRENLFQRLAGRR